MPSPKSVIDDIFDFLASVQLALTILIALAVAAVGGTIVPQDLTPQQYLAAYGPKLYTFLSYLDMFDMYNSWWFRLLMGILVLNLIVCSINRLPMTVRLTRPIDPERVGLDFLSRQFYSQSATRPGTPLEVMADIQPSLAKNLGSLRKAEPPWGLLMFKDRGAFSRYGAYIVHASLLLIVIGALMGGWWGFSAYLNLSEGQSAQVATGRRPAGPIDLPFTIRLDKFAVSFYENGQPSEFRSNVTFMEDGQEALQTEILVNHPKTFQGVTFYLGSYGQDRLSNIRLSGVRQPGGGTFDLTLEPGQPVSLPDGAGTVTVTDFAENIMNLGPGAKLNVRTSQGKEYTDWAFKKRPDFIPPPPGPFTFALEDFSISYYSVFQVNRDPGAWLVFVGCGVMLIGFIITFLFSHQKIFLGLTREGDLTRIVLAGSAHRNREAFRSRLDGLAVQLGLEASTEKDPKHDV